MGISTVLTPKQKLQREFQQEYPYIQVNWAKPKISKYVDDLLLTSNMVHKTNLLADYILSQDLADHVQL